MDAPTVGAYDSAAAAFAAEWAAQPPPTDLQDSVRRFFSPGPTADIGCGSGRDTAWLADNGYEPVGYDASRGLIDEARRRYPALAFTYAELPELAGIPQRFVNVLCETVIMHLPPGAISRAVTRLMEIMLPGGTLYLSWRVTEAADRRDESGRLYAAFDPELVLASLSGSAILLDEQRASLSSGKIIRRIVARKPGETG
jgi:SAM-dependent methyltransferase